MLPEKQQIKHRMIKVTDEMIVVLHLKKEKDHPFAPLAFHTTSTRLEYKDFYSINLYQEPNPVSELNETKKKYIYIKSPQNIHYLFVLLMYMCFESMLQN